MIASDDPNDRALALAWRDAHPSFARRPSQPGPALRPRDLERLRDYLTVVIAWAQREAKDRGCRNDPGYVASKVLDRLCWAPAQRSNHAALAVLLTDLGLELCEAQD